MKRELYENYLLMRYIHMTMEQINPLTDHQKVYYIEDIEEYLKTI